MRIVHARVFPMDAPVIEDGYVDMRDGRIVSVGPMAAMPRTDGEVLDAGGGGTSALRPSTARASR